MALFRAKRAHRGEAHVPPVRFAAALTPVWDFLANALAAASCASPGGLICGGVPPFSHGSSRPGRASPRALRSAWGASAASLRSARARAPRTGPLDLVGQRSCALWVTDEGRLQVGRDHRGPRSVVRGLPSNVRPRPLHLRRSIWLHAARRDQCLRLRAVRLRPDAARSPWRETLEPNLRVQNLLRPVDPSVAKSNPIASAYVTLGFSAPDFEISSQTPSEDAWFLQSQAPKARCVGERCESIVNAQSCITR